jgi:hypothetical protein
MYLGIRHNLTIGEVSGLDAKAKATKVRELLSRADASPLAGARSRF